MDDADGGAVIAGGRGGVARQRRRGVRALEGDGEERGGGLAGGRLAHEENNTRTYKNYKGGLRFSSAPTKARGNAPYHLAMRLPLAAILLVACGASNEPGGEAVAAGTGGAGGDGSPATGSGGDGGVIASTASSSAAESSSISSSAADASSSASTGGEGGAAASTGAAGGGGSGGESPCSSPACVDNARVRCNPECPTGFDCDDDVCSVDSAWSVGTDVALVQLPPIVVQYEACEACGGGLYSLRIALPHVDAGCVVVEAPPGIGWDVSSDPEQACATEVLGCERAAFTDPSWLYVFALEPADYARDVIVRATADENCVGVPAPTCDVGCNGAGG